MIKANLLILGDMTKTLVFHVFSKGVGFFIPFLIARWFGLNQDTDSFFLSYSVIWFFCIVFSDIGRSLAVPFISEKISQKKSSTDFINSIMSFIIIFLLVLYIFFLCTFKPILSTITGLSLETTNHIYIMSIILFPTIIFLAMSGFLEGFTNQSKNFLLPPIALTIRSLSIIAILFALKDILKIYSIAFSYLIGEFIYLVTLLTATNKILNFKYRLSFKKTVETMVFLKKSIYHFFYVAFTAGCSLVDKLSASFLSIGSISYITYCEKIYLVFFNLLSLIPARILLSYWSEEYYSKPNNHNLISKIIKTSLVIIIFFTMVCTILSYYSFEITKLFFLKGVFLNKDDILMVSKLTKIAIYTLLPTTIMLIITRYYLILQDTKTLMKVGLFKIVLNIAGNIIGIKYFGIIGIIWSLLIHQWTSTLVLLGILIVRNTTLGNHKVSIIKKLDL